MAAVQACALPEEALLKRYRDSGDYTDCFCTVVDWPVSLPEFINAFYTTPLFKSERIVLKWMVSKPSTDQDVAALASNQSDSFAAWSVEARAENQILLCDFQGNTRSWLMVRSQNASTELFFGSAVTAATDQPDGSRKLKRRFNFLLRLHRFYSVALLKAARRRFVRTKTR